MNTKVVSAAIRVLLIAFVIYSVYTTIKLQQRIAEVNSWKSKYEEALLDMENAYFRLKEKDDQLKKALQDAEQHQAMAEQALAELKKQKAKK